MLNRLCVAVSLLRTATCRRGIAWAKRVINCFKQRSNGFEKTDNTNKELEEYRQWKEVLKNSKGFIEINKEGKMIRKGFVIDVSEET